MPRTTRASSNPCGILANKLRGSVESSEYKHVVPSLIFLKFASNKFEHRRAELEEEGKEKYLDMVEFYAMKNLFYLPEKSRWSFVHQYSKQVDVVLKVDTARSTTVGVESQVIHNSSTESETPYAPIYNVCKMQLFEP